MIATAISRVTHELNQTLKRRFNSTEDLVVVSNLVEPDGSPVGHAADKVAAFLVNIERETVPHRGATRSDNGLGLTGFAHPPIYLNLMVMFAANFSGGKYAEALKFISHTIGFFQARPVLDHQTTPDLDPGIERLAFEIENLSTADLGNLWGVMGGRYVPSVLLRIRMVVIDQNQLFAQVPAVTRPVVDVAPVGAL
jgi:hypothetical protein